MPPPGSGTYRATVSSVLAETTTRSPPAVATPLAPTSPEVAVASSSSVLHEMECAVCLVPDEDVELVGLLRDRE